MFLNTLNFQHLARPYVNNFQGLCISDSYPLFRMNINNVYSVAEHKIRFVL